MHALPFRHTFHPMDSSGTRFFFDYLDPFSYLMDLEIRELDDGEGGVERVPLEMRPPPQPLLDPDGPEWRRLWQEATAAAGARSLELTAPPLLPWTRKAHELVFHADAKGLRDEVHRAVFDAVFRDGADVGRVDVLVEIARGLGLDATETKAVLDVDRYAASVSELRRLASASGVTRTPTLWLDGRTLQGFHNRDALRTFLRSS